MLSGQSQVSPRTVWTVGLHASALALCVLALFAARTVIGWVLLAALVALALEPLVQLAERRGLGHTAAVLVVWGLLTLLGAGLVWMLVPMLVDQVQALAHALPRLVEQARHHHWLDRYLGQEGHPLTESVAEHARTLAMPALKVLRAALGLVLEGITIYFLALFMLLFGRDLAASALGWLEPPQRARWVGLGTRMHAAVSGFTLGTLLVAAVTGVVTTLLLMVTGVPYFLAVGLLVGALEVIPFIGMLVAMVLVGGLTLATQGTGTAVGVLVALQVFLQLKNHLLNPLIQRKTIDMNPLLITLVMLLGTSIAGVLGAVLALPLAGAAQVVLRAAQRERAWRWGELEAPAEEEVARDARAPGEGPRAH